MANTMKFGPIGRMVDIPCPQTGMGFTNNKDVDITDLISGGRSVRPAPTTFKTYDMEWKGNTAGLQPLMDMYNGVYGQGPFYMLDPNFKGANLLPTRWASAYQLAYLANGWRRPQITATPASSRQPYQAVFTGIATDLPATDVSEFSITIPAVDITTSTYFLRAFGEVTGGAVIRWSYVYGDSSESVGGDIVPTTEGAPVQMPVYGSAIVLRLVVPAGSTLTLRQLNYTTSGANSGMQRTNYAVNPRGNTNTTSWNISAGTGGAATLTRMAVGGPDGGSYIRYTQTTANSGGTTGPFLRTAGDTTVGLPGDVRYGNAWVRTSVTRSMRETLHLKNTANVDITVVSGASVTCTANVWTKVPVALVTATGAYTKFQSWISNVGIGTVALGETFDVMTWISETDGNYFDGSFATGSPRRNNLILNPASNSSSTTGWTPLRTTLGAQNSLITGQAQKYFRATVTDISAGSYTQRADTTTSNGSVVPGQTYQISTWLRTTGGARVVSATAYFLDSTNAQVGSSVLLGTVTGATFVNVSATMVAPALSDRVLVRVGITDQTGWAINDFFDYGAVYVGAAGTYFDGSSAAGAYSYGWASTAFNSESIEYNLVSALPYRYLWSGTAGASNSIEFTSAYDGALPGTGVGSVQFTGNLQGSLVGTVVDRIGLSVEITEVEQ